MIWLMKGQKRGAKCDVKCEVVQEKCDRMSQARAALAIVGEAPKLIEYWRI
jgi:hypothetical protein